MILAALTLVASASAPRDPLLARLEAFVVESAAPNAAPAAPTASGSAWVEPLSLEPSAAPQSRSRRRQQGSPHEWGPQTWISVSGYAIDGRYDTPFDNDFEEDPAFGLDFGLFNWRGELGIGLEAGLIYGGYEIEGDSFGLGAEQVDVWRGLLGIRLVDRGPEDSSFLPYVRAGLMYRLDDGESFDEDGLGWYAGGGFDWRITPQLAIGPTVLFNEAQSRNAREWMFGLVLTLGL